MDKNKHELKQEKILVAGIGLMRTNGYNGTSVKDIVDAAGVPKGSFYNYFDSKEDFVLQALDYVASDGVATCQTMLADKSRLPLARLVHYFEACTQSCCAVEYASGCFIGNLGQEMSDTNDAIRIKVKAHFSKFTALITSVLEEAGTQGELDRSVPPSLMAEFIYNAWQGALLRAKASRSRESLDVFLDNLARMVARR